MFMETTSVPLSVEDDLLSCKERVNYRSLKGIDSRIKGKRQKVNDPKKYIYMYKDEYEGKISE